MRTLPFPRRLQLVKLLRAHGLRDVERMREDELREALARLQVLLPDDRAPWTPPADVGVPSSSSMMMQTEPHAAEAPPPVPDDVDDRYALPRFREPRVFVPEAQRSFVRAIPVKPRVLFVSWDVEPTTRAETATGHLELRIREVLGVVPSLDEMLALPVGMSVDVLLDAPGWYVPVAPERLAIVVTLVVEGRAVASSNVALTPPARPAPAGPLWTATVTPGVDRRTLLHGGLLRPRPELPTGVDVHEDGEVDASRQGLLEKLPFSASRMRPPPAIESAEAPLSSSSFASVLAQPAAR